MRCTSAYRLFIAVALFLGVGTILRAQSLQPRELRFDRNGYPLPQGSIARLGVPPALTGFAWNLGWTGDGKRFVVVDWSGVSIFDATTGRLIESQTIGAEQKSQFTPLSRDGRLLFLLNGRAGLLYDTDTADIRSFTLPAPFADPERKVYSLSLSADCRFLAGVASAASQPGVAWRFDLARNRFTRVIQDRADLQSVRLSPDGKRIYATGGSLDPELTARDLIKSKEIWTVPLIGVSALRAISSDGRQLAVSDVNGVTVFDAANGKALLTAAIDSSLPQSMWSIDLSPDGSRLAATIGREVIVWSVETGKVQHRFPHPARMLAFSPDGQSLLTASAWVQRWDLATGKPMYPQSLIDKMVAPTLLRWSGDGKRLLSVWPGDWRGEKHDWWPTVLAAWDVETSSVLWRVTHTSDVLEATIDRTGSAIRAFSRDNKLWSWTLGDRVVETSVLLRDTPIDSLNRVFEFLPDGRFLAQDHSWPVIVGELYSATGQYVSREVIPALDARTSRRFGPEFKPFRSIPGTVLLSNGKRFDLVSGRPIPSLDLDENQYSPVDQVTTGGSALIACRVRFSGSGDDVGVLLWEALTGGYVAQFNPRQTNRIGYALSPDGRWFAHTEADHLGLTDVADYRRLSATKTANPDNARRLLRISPGAAAVGQLTFSPDSLRLASAHEDGTVLIWTVEQPRRANWVMADENAQWTDLASPEAKEAWKSMWHLLDHPTEATKLLAAHLKPIPVIKDTADQIALLDHGRYAIREKAMTELIGRGESIEGELLATLKTAKSEEQRRRVEQLLLRLDPAVPPTGETLRSLRCIWLLERIGTPDAKKLLERMAGGAVGSRVTVEAKAAHQRLAATR